MLRHVRDHEEFPVAEIRKVVRDFGDAHGLTSATVIGRALDIPTGTLNEILYCTHTKVVKGKTVREIKEAIRHFDPRTNDETKVKGESVRLWLLKWMKNNNKNKFEVAKILDIPHRRVGRWIDPDRHPKEFKAKVIRPILAQLNDYTVDRNERAREVDVYNETYSPGYMLARKNA